MQAHLASKSRTTYKSPFVYRTDLAGGGLQLVREARAVYRQYG
jgi:transaldolase